MELLLSVIKELYFFILFIFDGIPDSFIFFLSYTYNNVFMSLIIFSLIFNYMKLGTKFIFKIT